MEYSISRDHSVKNQKQMILNTFDWDAVATIFKTMGWVYATSLNPADDYIPDPIDCRLKGSELLDDVTENLQNTKTISSGRFEAHWSASDESLSLRFIPLEVEILHDESSETIYVVGE